MRGAGEAKNEKEVWRFINREKNSRKEINEKITEVQWNEHFMNLLGGIGERQERVRKKQREERSGSEEQEEIRREEIEKVISEMKSRKAAGADGLPTEEYGFMEVTV
ncbi:axoneme-associated protein [Lasius niger]|uniref:Axoneme-associated protein n=1 Tax=Lasius niger TaxID=67767 RepID=A0A0J7MRX5_LASNI|nr:axoneme-associated protein [Lasius niger]